MSSPIDCVDYNHFDVVDGQIIAQPWMQHRHVAHAEAAASSGAFPVAGGGNKNVLLHDVNADWTNDSPVSQDLYGLITRGGSQVVLQARSRGALVILSGLALGLTAGPLGYASLSGVGADIGLGGVLSFGTGYCVASSRFNSSTIPLVPERTGLLRLAPGAQCHARVQVWFSSEFWETTLIDGGEQGTESRYLCGDTGLDLFAIPVI